MIGKLKKQETHIGVHYLMKVISVEFIQQTMLKVEELGMLKVVIMMKKIIDQLHCQQCIDQVLKKVA